MKETSLVKYDKSIISKIRGFFRRMIHRKERKDNIEEIKIERKNETSKQPNIIKELQEDFKKQNLREDIFNIVEKDDTILETLSNEQLREILKIYEEKVSNIQNIHINN